MEEQRKEEVETPVFSQDEPLQIGVLQASVPERSFADGPTQSAQVLQVPVSEYNKRGIKAKDPEFVVAVIVFSILGGALVLAALVLFGIYYMTDFLLGMCLYAFVLLVILISELVIRKKLPKLSLVLTSIGIGGVYVSTYVNSGGGWFFDLNSIYHRYHGKVLAWLDPESVRGVGLNNFSVRVGVCIAVFFTLLVLLYGWKRQIDLYRVVGILFCCLCIRPKLDLDGSNQQPALVITEFLVLGAVILFLNLIHSLLPSKNKTMAYLLPMVAIPLFMERLSRSCFYWLGNGLIESVPEMVCLAGVLFVIHLYFYQLLKAHSDLDWQKDWKKTVTIVAYVVTLTELFLMVTDVVGATWSDIFNDYFFMDRLCKDNLPALHFTMLSVCAMGLICFMMIYRYREKWILYYFGCVMFYQVYLAVRDAQYPEESIADIWCLLGLLILTKLLTMRKVRAVRVADAVLTFIACGVALAHSKEWYSYLLMAVLVLGIFTGNYWHTYYELLVTYTLAFFVIKGLPLILKPTVFVGVLFVGILVVNHVKWMRGKYPVIYNAVVLAGQSLSYFVLLGERYRNSYVTYLCMLVLGLAIITLVLQEKYQLKCPHQLLIIELFLSYMILVMRLRYSFVTSILLMAVAVLVGVAGGFLMNQKSARICGLILSILVCSKIVLYDFSGGPVKQRIFLFLAVGVLALVIVGIYIVLEKRTQKKRIEPGKEV